MNELDFRIEQYTDNGLNHKVTKILIDGQDLIDLLKEHELPLAKKEGSPDIAGQYMGLNPKTLYKNLTNQPDNCNSQDDKSDILDCECGVWGCWSFMTEVKEGASVIWTNFEQLHRGRNSQINWDYSKLGPFEFDKSDYQVKLKQLNS